MKKVLLFLLICLASVAWGQNSYYTDRATALNPLNNSLVPIPYGQVRVCTSNNGTSPCTNLATVYDASTGAQLSVGPSQFGQVTTDFIGKFSFQAPPGNYYIQIAGAVSNTPQQGYTITVGVNSVTGALIVGGNNNFTGSNTFSGAVTANAGVTATGTDTFGTLPQIGIALGNLSGCDPTGVADSTACVNTAIASSQSLNLPILCDGTFKITSTLSTIDPATNSWFSLKGCTIKAGAVMTNMAVIGGAIPPPYSKGMMQGITWDGNSQAATALFLGCSGVSCSTNYVNGYTFIGVRMKSTTSDCMQTGNNVWAIGFFGGGAFNCGGSILIQTGNNSGEAISFTNFDFANNTGWGLQIQNPGTGGASYTCNGCAFDQNTLGQIQLGTSYGNGNVFACNGCHFEYNSLNTTTRQLQNFGDFTCSGCFFTGGTGNSTYQIDNEGTLTMVGGGWANAGSGTNFNSAQTGGTFLFGVHNLPSEAVETVAFDINGNMYKVPTITGQGAAATALNFPNGGMHAGGFIASDSGLKPAGGAGQTPITGDGTNVILPNGATKIGGSSASVIGAIFNGNATLTYTAISAQTGQEQTMTITGASTTNNGVACSPRSTLGNANITWGAWVSASNTVSVRVVNPTAGSITPNAVIWGCTVSQ